MSSITWHSHPDFAPYTAKLCSYNKGPRARPPLWDIGLGCILWLPTHYRPPPGSTLRDPPDGASNHPILVLSVAVTGPEDAIISFALLRSFSATSGPDTSQPGFRDRYAELSPYPPSRKNTTVSPPPLMLEHRHKNRSLTAVSYVDLSVVYSAQWQDLHVYARKHEFNGALFRLDKASFAYVWERMNRCVGLGPMETWVPTKQLREDFARRYIRVRDAKQNTSTRVKGRPTTAATTTTTGAYAEIYSFMLIFACLVPAIMQARSRTPVGRDTPEKTTMREGINATTCFYVLYSTVWPLFCRSVRQNQGARSRGLLDLIPAVLGILLFCVARFGPHTKHLAEIWLLPQIVVSMAPERSRPRDQDKKAENLSVAANLAANGAD